MCCVTGIVLAMQGILRVSADLLKPGSVLISVKHWDFPRALPTVISILAACLCGRAHPLLLQEPQTPAARHQKTRHRQSLLPLDGKVCAVTAGGQQQ